MVAFMSASNSSVTHLRVCMSYVLDILQFYTRQQDEVSSSVAFVCRDNKGSPDKFLEYPDVVQVALPLAGSISSKAPEYGQNFQSLDMERNRAAISEPRGGMPMPPDPHLVECMLLA